MMNRKNKKGITILIIVYFIVAVLLVLGTAFFYLSFNESKLTQRQNITAQALSIAEAGIERAIYELRQDFLNDSISPSWIDSDINGINFTPNYASFSDFILTTELGSGQYTVQLKNVAGNGDEIWIRSTAVVSQINKTIQAYIKIVNYSPWNNAIFAGTGYSGILINGNVDIRGSVHILGDGLGDSGLAIDMSGSGNIGNNYQGIPSELESRIPDCPTTIFDGETVDSLSAEVRIKNGQAGLSGTAQIGTADSSGNSYKETVDAVYVTDGYAGNKGEENVYSDNGTQNGYDLGDSIEFPSLSSPYEGYTTYQDYLKANALVISNPSQLREIANITPDSSFSYSNANGAISMDSNGNLTIDGIVYIDGGSLNMNKRGSEKEITYSGKGSLLVTEDVQINVNLLTSGADSYPNNIIGFMTPNEISFNSADINVMGIFYAEEKITSSKQTSVAGTFVSNYFDMGQQVPSIYQVPSIIDNLPPGMIGAGYNWVIKTVAWQEE